jgi:hypothetical protein
MLRYCIIWKVWKTDKNGSEGTYYPANQENQHTINHPKLSYIACLFKLVLPTLLDYGIGLEAHGQNIVARVCLQTGEIKGFGCARFRWYSSTRPTIRQHGVKLGSVPSSSATLTHNLHAVWSKVHHAMLQSHVCFLLSSLGLDNEGRWSIVRELPAVLRPARSSLAQSLYDFFLADAMPFKGFLRCGWRGSVVMWGAPIPSRTCANQRSVPGVVCGKRGPKRGPYRFSTMEGCPSHIQAIVTSFLVRISLESEPQKWFERASKD